MQNSTEQIAKKLFEYMKAQNSGLNMFKLRNIKDLLLKLSIAQPKIKQSLFHFIDVLPVLKSSKQKAQFFTEYVAPYLPSFIHQSQIFSQGLELATKL